jgi:succinate dehydrogenase/fumarate reductase flavoprotein subunit
MPVSRVPYADGSFGVYPHSFERGKPGVIAVSAGGRRFVNESAPYHDFVGAMIGAREPGRPAAAFLICDARFIRRYGLGMAKPFPIPLGPYLRSGYLVRCDTIRALAIQLGIDADALSDTLAKFNSHAAAGMDPELQRGENVYNRYLGDPAQAPNPCIAPIDRPPYYAVRILPGDLGTFAGLKTDSRAAVLDHSGTAIPGLFAVGADMASLFAGRYPGPGINLGPAMTFGYLCARRLAEKT